MSLGLRMVEFENGQFYSRQCFLKQCLGDTKSAELKSIVTNIISF